jgi:signal transduction histidine kinase/ligand-binding sensor domain-containing protein/DNA-binding response OmpR family regulator
MWFSSKDGLNRFDGQKYKIYKNNPNDSLSLGNNFVQAIYQDIDYNLWIGTDSYLYLFDYENETFHLFSVQSDLGVVIRFGVTSICSENDSILWFGTMRQGAFCYNKNSGKLRQYLPHKHNKSIQSEVVWQVFRDYSGTIWVGTREGLNRYNRETDTFSAYTSQNSQNTLTNDEIFSIYEDSEGNLWVGTWSGGIACLDKSSHTFRSFLNTSKPPFVSKIRAIFEYDKFHLMVGADDGLYLLNKQTGESQRMDNPKDFNSLSDQNVYTIYKDREGGIWIGTYFGGVNYMLPNANIIEHYYPNLSPNSLSGKAVSQFCEDQNGNLWIATEDGGLNYFDTQTKKFTVFLSDGKANSLSYHNLHALLLDDDKLWIGTFSRGLDVLDLKSNRFKNYMYDKNDTTSLVDGCVFSLYKDSRNDIYVGTPYGLCRYNRTKNNFVRLHEVPDFIYDIKEDTHGYLWIASYANGVYRLNYETGIWKNYTHNPADEKSVAFNKLTGIHIDSKDHLWFATEGGGICKYNYESDDFTTINESDGLPNNVIYSILNDKYGNIWLSSNRGISRLNPNTMQIKTYTNEDGLQGNEFNYSSGYKSRNGLFYFGGINGFNVFDPDKLSENSHVPSVVITSLEVLDDGNTRKIKVTEPVKLRYNQASFRIGFVSLSFQAPEKNKYAYLLEGMDTKWTELGTQRTISFINLPPGKYIFHVKGSNNDDVWNEEGASVEIIILPPFWKSTLASVFYLVLLLILGFFAFRYYTNYNRQKQQRKLDAFRREKNKEMYESKINFFTNIAHEIRTPVSLIKAPLECIVNSDDGTEETKENLAVIGKNTDRLLELINQLLDFRKIEENLYKLRFTQVNVNELLTGIYFRFKPASESRRITIELQLPPQQVLAYADKEALTKIISNLLSNALKYTNTTIHISLTEDKSVSGDYFEISMSDDGIGIPDEMKTLVFEPFFQIESDETADRKKGTGIGLALTKQLVERHEGKISIMDNAGKGVVFVVRIPNYLDKIQNETEKITDSQEDILAASSSVHPDKTVILIVEDNEDLRSFIAKNLKKNYSVFTAANGKYALEILEQEPVDLIVSDIVMPEMDGLEFSRIVKQDEQFSHIPVILLSAKTNTQTKVQGLEQGADSYIEKPFSIDYLKAQISSLIENRKIILEKFSKSPVVPYGSIAHTKRDEVFLNRLNEEIEQHLSDEQFSIEKLAVSMSMSQSNLQRKIKGLTGMVPNDYIRITKLKKAAQLLKSSEYRINEICYIVGFSSPSYFSKCFQKQFGLLPKDFYKKN